MQKPALRIKNVGIGAFFAELLYVVCGHHNALRFYDKMNSPVSLKLNLCCLVGCIFVLGDGPHAFAKTSAKSPPTAQTDVEAKKETALPALQGTLPCKIDSRIEENPSIVLNEENHDSIHCFADRTIHSLRGAKGGFYVAL